MSALVYLSGPISGQTYTGATEWREWVRTRLQPGINAVDPMRGKHALKTRMAGRVFEGNTRHYADVLNCRDDPFAVDISGQSFCPP